MNPGLPGTGIGGLFYILVALTMPICEIWRGLRGDATLQWPLVTRQFIIAAGAVAAMTGVFWALDTALMHEQLAGYAAGGYAAGGWVMWSLRASALAVTTGVLATVLSAMHVVRLCLRLRTARLAVH